MKREFYVGYLPLPRGIKSRLLLIVPALLVVGILAAAAITTQQQDPGEGVWDLNEVTELRGKLVVDPYPAILVPNANHPGGRQTFLLASQTKTGVRSRVEPLIEFGKQITVRGNLAQRDGQALLTLLGDDTAIETHKHSVSELAILPKTESLGRFQLTGQIIDPKCYLGAMKPGEGKIHKACATLCIKGGIPPMFMTQTADNERKLYLLTSPDGEAIFDPIEPYIADPITAQGIIEQHGDLTWFKIDPQTIERLR